MFEKHDFVQNKQKKLKSKNSVKTNEYVKDRKETDLKVKRCCNVRSGTNHAYKAQTAKKKQIHFPIFLECFPSFLSNNDLSSALSWSERSQLRFYVGVWSYIANFKN